MVTVPVNTFVGAIDQPAGAPITADPFQITGAALNVNTSASCPDLFSSSTGAAYCSLACLNTCPGYYPNATLGLFLQLHQNQTLLSAVRAAATVFDKAAATQSAMVTIKGPIAFSVPAGLNPSAVATVARDIEQLLPSNAPFPLTTNVCAACKYCNPSCLHCSAPCRMRPSHVS